MEPTPAITLLPLNEAHLAEIIPIEREAFRDPWTASCFAEILARSDKNWVALAGGRVAGYLVTEWVLEEIHILNIAVARAWRRRGVARMLMNHLFREARDAGMRDLYLEVRASNGVAQDLYRGFGFKVVTRRRRYYNDGEDALVMHCALPVADDHQPGGVETGCPARKMR